MVSFFMCLIFWSSWVNSLTREWNKTEIFYLSLTFVADESWMIEYVEIGYDRYRLVLLEMGFVLFSFIFIDNGLMMYVNWGHEWVLVFGKWSWSSSLHLLFQKDFDSFTKRFRKSVTLSRRFPIYRKHDFIEIVISKTLVFEILRFRDLWFLRTWIWQAFQKKN